MKVDDLKYEVLVQHHLLRALLVDIGDVSQLVAAGDDSWEAILRKGVHQLAEDFLRHMGDEERLLDALAHEGHAAAAEHLAEFRRSHSHQRMLIASFTTLIDGVHSTQLVEIIEAMIHVIVLDMDHEEAAIFGSQLPKVPLSRVA